jgi:hypothetical protein
MQMLRPVIAVMLLVLSACRGADSSSIADQFSASESVDLATAVPGDWDRVCVLGPYSNNALAAQALGFTWPVETLTEIEHNDGISLLVFVQGEAVAKHVEHSRRSGDFSNLTGRCYSQANAKFVYVSEPVKGWPGLFPADEA